MLLQVILLLLAALTAFLIGEYVRKLLGYGNEVARKLVHVLHAGTLAVLVFLTPVGLIVGFEVLFLVTVLIARYLLGHYQRFAPVRYLAKMYQVGRTTWGELLFPVGAIVAVLLAESPWIFAAAILTLGLADTMAALIGRSLAKTNVYQVFGQNKSVIGSTAFLVTALIILGMFSVWNGAVTDQMFWANIVSIALILTIAENLGVYGLDNLFIPLIAVVALNVLA